MNYKIINYDTPSVIPADVKQKLIDITKDVYDADSAKELVRELDDNFPYGLVIILDEKADKIIAFGCYAKSALDFDIWEFAWAMVREEYRGQGLGKVLNDERIKVIKKLGGKKILCVTKKLWHLERSGFKSIYVFADTDQLMVCEL